MSGFKICVRVHFGEKSLLFYENVACRTREFRISASEEISAAKEVAINAILQRNPSLKLEDVEILSCKRIC